MIVNMYKCTFTIISVYKHQQLAIEFIVHAPRGICYLSKKLSVIKCRHRPMVVKNRDIMILDDIRIYQNIVRIY